MQKLHFQPIFHPCKISPSSDFDIDTRIHRHITEGKKKKEVGQDIRIKIPNAFLRDGSKDFWGATIFYPSKYASKRAYLTLIV